MECEKFSFLSRPRLVLIYFHGAIILKTELIVKKYLYNCYVPNQKLFLTFMLNIDIIPDIELETIYRKTYLSLDSLLISAYNIFSKVEKEL